MSVVVGWNSSTHIFLLDAEITEGKKTKKIPISSLRRNFIHVNGDRSLTAKKTHLSDAY